MFTRFYTQEYKSYTITVLHGLAYRKPGSIVKAPELRHVCEVKTRTED